MEYNYELLRKCHGLRFRATFYGKPQEGIIKVTSENVMLCFGDEDPGYSATFGRMCARSFSKETFDRLPRDFEIVPRDPETYKDWQVGDVIRFYGNNEIIFRSGEVVVFKYSNDKASSIYTCSELFRRGYRLVRTDIEEQIIEEQKKYEPQDGDIVAWKHQENDRNHAISIYKEERRAYATIYAHGGTEYSTDVTFAMDIIRPATDEEKQRLFDAMAKEGKRWNAEKKVVEDIPKPYEFTKGEPVLVRDNDENIWILSSFIQFIPTSCFHVTNGVRPSHWKQCIPYNERTMHLLGTNDDYEEFKEWYFSGNDNKEECAELREK